MNGVLAELQLHEDFNETAHQDDPHRHESCFGSEGCRCDQFS